MRILVSEKLSPHKMKTPEGYLICTDAILSRTGKQTYRRSEIWGDACDNADAEVEVDRTADEVFNEKTLASFENKPICIEHPDEDVNVNNHNMLSVGFVRDIKRGKVDGQDVMLGTLVITDADAVEAIERGDYAELSCGYNCDVVDEENPQQRNIRGNHVALCERGRAGIARIIDSINDEVQKYAVVAYPKGEQGNRIYIVSATSAGDARAKFEKKHPNASISTIDIATSRDIEFAKNKGNERFIDTVNDDKEFRITQETAFGKVVIAKWSAKSKEDALKEFLEMNPAYKTGHGLIRAEDSVDDAYASKRLLEKIKQQIELNGTKSIGQLRKRLEGDMELQKMSNENIKQICKSVLNIELGDEEEIKDADFSKQTKQGYQVLEMYRDGGRLHAIFKRANDYGVALGYDTTDGQWAQGMYDYTTLEKARKALMETKPYARRIQDAIEDSASAYHEFNHLIDLYKSKPAKIKALIESFKETDSDLSGDEKEKPLAKAKSYLGDSAEKTYEVSYVKDDTTFIRNVKATSLQEAIKKVKE